ncbi:hypothetical protein J2S74_000890 [Evansella vedderi]|uniref:Uncharacterized protein n=1 Tax=Evansella vedderi TaxID=38282 RepID=A0ABT9ZQK3_9BACI|nr:hypothetical protein [Evansella vedderi]
MKNIKRLSEEEIKVILRAARDKGTGSTSQK